MITTKRQVESEKRGHPKNTIRDYPNSVNEVAKGSAASQLCDLDDIPLPQRLLLAYSRKIPVLVHQKRSRRSPVIDRPTGRPRSWPRRTHQPVASRIRSQAPIGG